MKDFTDQLEARLRVLAEAQAHAPEPRPLSPAPPPRRRRRPLVLGSLTAALGTGAAAFALTSTSYADLPILSTPTTDATSVRGALPAAREAGVDFSRAHAFGTPGGPGYVLVTPERDRICVAIPDPETQGEYGGACRASLAEAERKGLAVELVGDRGTTARPRVIVAFVLPEDARRVRLRAADGSESAPPIESGVVVTEITADAELRWEVDGREGRRALQGPSTGVPGVLVTCPGTGERVRVPRGSEATSGPAPVDRATLRRLCR